MGTRQKKGSIHREFGKPIYPTGFHVWLTKAAHKYRKGAILQKVYFRNIIAKGYQWDCFVVVARERYVCDKTKKPPKD